MRAEPDCLPCLQGLVRRVARLPALGQAGQQVQAQEDCLRILETFLPGISVPTRVSSALLRHVRSTCGCEDPFGEVKEEEYARGRAAARVLAARVEPNIRGLLRLSVAGNQIDFFRPPAEVEALWADGAPELAIDDAPDLMAALVAGGDVLFLADNAGEVPFDLPLVEALQAGGNRVRYAVKGGPSQNDVTRADVERLGLQLPGLVDTGSDHVGCELAETGAEFRAAWVEAGTVIAKGMANWETLTEYPDALRGRAVFFLLCAKCRPVAASLGVETGRAVLFNARRLTEEGGRP